MSNSPPDGSRLVFGDLLDYLRRQGFTIGVDHYLRLQELLNKVSGHCAPSDLKTILCPIFASNERQQSQFYAAFDSYFNFSPPVVESNAVEADNEILATSFAPPEPVAARKWPYALGAALVVILAVVLALLFLPKRQELASAPEQKIEEQAPEGEPRQPDAGQPQAQPNEVEQSQIENPPAIQTEQAEPAPQTEAETELSFYQRYGAVIRLAVLIIPVVFFLFYEWYRYNRRRLALQRQRGKKPPYVWPIRVEAATPRFYDSEDFYTAARLMRRRQVGEYHRLDVNATIAATVESLGYPKFRYRPDSKPPEYLALIDRASFRDHQAQLFGNLTAALEQEGLFVARYFYDGDPRVCCNEAGDCFHLVELRDKYPGDRLLIFGNGEKIIDPVTGKVESWAATLLEWQDRAVLTPEAAAGWGLREITLADQFILLPATVEGLVAVVDHFESTASRELRSWRQDAIEAPPRELNQSGIVEALRNYLGEETFQWLCACAVYPELHWDLTMYLASLPCMDKELVREKNLLRLIRLPWFRSGTMPDDLRWLLIRELDRDKEKVIRSAIIELLEKNPPPKETFAENVYQLNLAVQRWLFRRSRKRRREMLQVMKSLPRSQATQDYTLLRFLESSGASPLRFLLPQRLRKVFYRSGVPAFGLRTSARLLATLIMVGMAWVIIRPPSPQEQTEQPPTEETPISEVSFTPPPGMVFIPGGRFMMGTDEPDADADAKPALDVTVQDFLLDETEVTNQQYQEFVKATGHAVPSHWRSGVFPSGDLPVWNVSWDDAKAYAAWANKRLPTEAEWEYAARGSANLKYPWGSKWLPGYSNSKENGSDKPVAVRSYSIDKSWCGVYDMAGNVSEWVEDEYKPYRLAADYMPYRPRLSSAPSDPGNRVYRGGAYNIVKEELMGWVRFWDKHDFKEKWLGFRCAKDVPKISSPEIASPVTAKAQNRNLSTSRPARNGNRNSQPIVAQNRNVNQPSVIETVPTGISGTGPTPTTGAIEGRVYEEDYYDQGIVGATVTARNPETGLTRSVLTGPNGYFFIGTLPPGFYTISARREGYASTSSSVVNNFPIKITQTVRLQPPPLALRRLSPRIIRKSGPVVQGTAIKRVWPPYPPEAKKAGLLGTVVVEVTIDEQGNVISARAISGHPLLKVAAVEAARQWTFTPTTLSGVPVKVIGTITFNLPHVPGDNK